MSGEIEHVSDSAFWVATFRALESLNFTLSKTR
jgi:hypothetical protein